MSELKTLEIIMNLLLNEDKQKAEELLNAAIPHEYIVYSKRSMPLDKKMKIYMEDGFIDRYSGDQLVFPNVLRIISYELPNVFPYHPNWKMSHCHAAYWKLFPTYDHIVPISRGGEDTNINIVTTSMLNNSLKSNWCLEETGFEIHKKGNLKEWDGMIGWYLKYIDKYGKPNIDNNFEKWHFALLKNIDIYYDAINN